MIDFNQFREHVVIPTLKYLDSEIPYSEEAWCLSNGIGYTW